jgi:hypothetical protein
MDAPRGRLHALVVAAAFSVAAGTVGWDHEASQAPGRERPAVSAGRIEQSYGRMPLFFYEDPYAEPGGGYLLQGRGASVRFTSSGLTVLLAPDSQSLASGRRAPFLEGVATGSGGSPPPPRARRLDLAFVGANHSVVVRGSGRGSGHVSYFRGGAEGWRTGLKTYRELRYRDLWPGIDLTISGVPGRLTSSFLVHPGADPSLIQLAARGADGLDVTTDAELSIGIPGREVRGPRPVAVPEKGSREEAVPILYRLIPGGWPVEAGSSSGGLTYGFEVGPYDGTRPLVVESALFVYAGFVGGPGDDRGLGIAIDPSGAAYATGETPSPLTGWLDAYVVKIRPDGTGFAYLALISGHRNDQAFDVAVDESGFAYVTGATESSQGTFPVTVGPDLSFNGWIDAFVCKLSPTGTRLVFCGYLGGNLIDFGEAIVLDAQRNVYVEGPVSSNQSAFPAKVGPDVTFNGGSYDVFVAKVRAVPNAPDVRDNLFWAGYIGGGRDDIGTEDLLTSGHIAVDIQGQLYVSGETQSREATFPDGDGFGSLPGPDQTQNGDWDAWVAKVAADGSGLLYAGYIGGSGLDFGFGMAVDGEGNAYITGHTNSTEVTFPDKLGPDVTFNGGLDAFVAKVNPLGTALVYAGYVGGVGEDRGLGVKVDSTGSLYVIGATASSEATFPVTVGPDLTHNGLFDAFVAKVKTNPADPMATNNYDFNGYIGGSADDAAFWVALDGSGGAYVVGDTESTEATFPDGDGFGPLPGPDQSANGGVDGFVVKIVV